MLIAFIYMYFLKLVSIRFIKNIIRFLSFIFLLLKQQLALCIACLCLCLFSSTVFALSATTTRYIQGNSPRISAENEAFLQSDEDTPFLDVIYKDEPLSLSLDDLPPQTIIDNLLLDKNSALITPKMFLDDLSTEVSIYVPLNATDKDGDRVIPTQPQHLESTVKRIYDYNNGSPIPLTEVQMNQRFSQLIAANIRPYVKLESAIKVSTRFGAPNIQYYPDPSIGITQAPMRRFFLNFPKIEVIGASPPSVVNWMGGINDNNWQGSWGFAHSNDLSVNFPTTGFNGAFFTLKITGGEFDVTNPELNWKIVKTPSDSNVSASVSVKNSSTLTVSLTGPNSGDSGGMGPLAFESPVTFEITDDFSAVSYKFRITKWFIPKKLNELTAATDALNYCSTITGYRPTTRAELTNSDHANATMYPPYDPITGANNGTNPSPSASKAVGHAIGSLFGEWGIPVNSIGVNIYPDSDFVALVSSTDNRLKLITSERYSAIKHYWLTGAGAVIISPYGSGSGGLEYFLTNSVVCVSE